MIWSGALDPLERLLSDWRFQIASRPASQSLTIVEIDSASLRALDSWPWPRGYYATAIESLRRAGAHTIGMDIDFSGRGDPAPRVHSHCGRSWRHLGGRPGGMAGPFGSGDNSVTQVSDRFAAIWKLPRRKSAGRD